MTDAPAAPTLAESEAPSGLNPLHVLARRWPFLAAGLVVGAALGVLLYSTAAPVYQSSAQVLVVKKRGDSARGEGDSRVVEDHVATQVTLIRSEKIRLAAARRARETNGAGLPADDRAVAGMIGAGLTVARDREAQSGVTSAGSGVLNLTFRGADPDVTRRLLEAVIQAHRDELYSIYDKASRDRMDTLDKLLEVQAAQRKTAGEGRIEALTKLRAITTEEVASVRARVSAQRDQIRALRTELSNLDAQLELVAKTGSSPEERQLTYAQLTAQLTATSRVVGAGAAELGGVAKLRALEAQRRELAKSSGLGKDHPRMLALDAQIAELKEELARPEAGASPVLDELGAFAKWVEQKKATAQRHQREIEAQLKKDEDVLKEAGGLQDQADALGAQVQQAEAEIQKLESEKLARRATQELGGYSSEPITPPGAGGKIAPVLPRSLMSGLAIGALLGAGLMVLAESRDKSFRSPAEIRQRLGLPVVGHIPRIRTAPPTVADAPAELDPSLVTALRPKSSEAESYRGLRTQLFFSTQGQGHQVIQVTSPTPGDGKSTLAANLAVSLGQAGKRTVLVDCDLRKPRVHKLFGVGAETGLAEVIAGQQPLAAAVVRSGVEGLDVLPCGPRPANPAELLGSPQFRQVLAELKGRYDFVIVDSPPVLAVADPAVVAPQVDGVLLVFRMSKTARPTAERAREVLGGVGANALGVIVNAAGDEGGGYGYGYGYGYSYGYGYEYRYTNYNYSDDYTSDADDDEKGPGRPPAA